MKSSKSAAPRAFGASVQRPARPSPAGLVRRLAVPLPQRLSAAISQTFSAYMSYVSHPSRLND
jgi:hypothetical protein